MTDNSTDRVEVTQAEIARLYASGAGNAARALEQQAYGLTSAEISQLALKAAPRLAAFREHWERGFRAKRGDAHAAEALRGSHAEEEGARDSERYDLGFAAGLGHGGFVSQRSFGPIEGAGFRAGQRAKVAA